MAIVINANEITNVVAELCISANIDADTNIRACIKQALDIETSEAAKGALNMIIDNMKTAETERMPLCQDTGMVVAFIEVGQNVQIIGSLTEAVNEGVRQGYRKGYFRSSVVRDPIDRINTLDNTPAIIHYNIVEGEHIKITIVPKGFGSENKNAVKMLNPSDGIEGVINFVMDTVQRAGADPCPPIIVGVGIGGTMEKAALLAKQALILDVKGENSDSYWAGIERDILKRINNELNIGAAGFRGVTTALGVRILTYPTHIAGLPVAVNIGCHVSRHKEAIIRANADGGINEVVFKH